MAAGILPSVLAFIGALTGGLFVGVWWGEGRGVGRLFAQELRGVRGGSVDWAEGEAAFHGVADRCLSVRVLGIDTRLDASLQGSDGGTARS